MKRKLPGGGEKLPGKHKRELGSLFHLLERRGEEMFHLQRGEVEQVARKSQRGKERKAEQSNYPAQVGEPILEQQQLSPLDNQQPGHLHLDLPPSNKTVALPLIAFLVLHQNGCNQG